MPARTSWKGLFRIITKASPLKLEGSLSSTTQRHSSSVPGGPPVFGATPGLVLAFGAGYAAQWWLVEKREPADAADARVPVVPGESGGGLGGVLRAFGPIFMVSSLCVEENLSLSLACSTVTR